MNTMKIKNVCLLATFLAIGWLFAACSSDSEDIVADEIEHMGEAVKAQFTISIPMSQEYETRQSNAIVQSSGDIAGFRGINEIKLYPSADASFTKDSKFIGRNIALTNLMIPSSNYYKSVDNYIPDGKLTSTSNSVIYGDVQLQIGTRTFLFYGKAIGKAYNEVLSTYTAADKFKYGSLIPAGLVDAPTDVSGFSFAPDPIVANINASASKRTAICDYLGSIAGTTGWSSSDNQGFKDLYNKFTSMTAGSSKNLEIAVNDLYFALVNNSNDLAQAICHNIAAGAVAITNTSESQKLVFDGDLAGYPSVTDNLPDGAAVLSWSGSTPSYALEGTAIKYNTFNAYDVDEQGQLQPVMPIPSITRYTYPASLYYWGCSTIGTSDESQEDLYKKNYTWDQIVNAKVGTTETKVFSGEAITSKTRSIVLKTPVEYAVGRFDISVVATLSSGSTTKLPDSGIGKDAHLIDPNKLLLTGVLIGGQREVDWQFLPKSNTQEYTIYDNVAVSNPSYDKSETPQPLEGHVLSTSATDYINRTLVLETAGKDGDDFDEVNVALEFLNNDQDFYGANGGIIPKGTKFYLVAKLKADNTTGTGTITNEEFEKTGGKVFKQDYVTIAKFVIANLTKAYNYIPDLRSPKVELGLSVNLEWQTGITFQHIFN